jgi:anti-sigma regulatory factor (Ser/Thr protein kinase)
MRDQSSDTGSEVTEVGQTQDRRADFDDDPDAVRTDGFAATSVPATPASQATMPSPSGRDGDRGFDNGRPASLPLRSEPGSVRLARRFVDGWLGSAASSQFGEDVQLVTSELVTNAVRHSSLSSMRLSRDGDCVLLEVDDEGSGVPEVAEHLSPTALSGRGLVIVERLVTRWGWRQLPGGGKRVWCELCAAGG